ncbi:ABC transporter permease [Peptostreptococcus equinus]|uniref:FtsX-like permease family protein n=1 Tax=Peptostreptococcus equinus TaxID=3003601 RepID=A0ABY7JME5_9FIRM|nr:FtsX-like permease family protein [Peptostreptococcus sp. CBA3647]WAW14502.1 FtsX-like permease family protein [Peptostreptococcus sp. CBA3647]
MYFKFGLRYIKKYEKRSFVIFLGFLLAILIGSTSSIMKQIANNAALKQSIEYNKYHIIVNNVDEKLLNYISRDKSIKNYKLVNYIDSSDISNPIIFNIIGTEDGLINNKIIKGRIANNKNEISAQSWVLKNLGKNVGDTLTYKSYKEKGLTKSLKIVGQIENNKNDLEKGIIELNTKSCGREIQKYNTLNIELKDSPQLRRSISLLKEKIKRSYKIEEKNIILNEELIEAYENDGSGIKESLIIISLVVLFSSIIIFSTYYVSLKDKIEDFAILRALGIKDSDLVKIIFTELFLLFIPALSIGIIGALILSVLLTDMGLNTMAELVDNNKIIYDIKLPCELLISLIFVFTLVSLVIALFTYFMSVRNIPIGLMKFNSGIKKITYKRVNGKYIDKIGISNYLSLRYLKKDNMALFLIIICIALSLSQIIYQSFLNDTEKIVFENWKNKGIQSISVSKSNPYNERARMTENDIKEINNINAIKANLWSANIYTRMDVPKSKINSMMYFKDINKSEYVKNVYKGMYKEYEDKYTIKNKILAYNDDALKYLEKDLISGSIDIQKMKKNNECVLLYPKYYINLDKKIDQRNLILKYKVGDQISVKIPKNLEISSKNPEQLYQYWQMNYNPKMKEEKFKISAIVQDTSIQHQFSVQSVDIILPYKTVKKIDSNIYFDSGEVIVKDKKNRKIVEDKLIDRFSKGNGFNVMNSLLYFDREESEFNEYLNIGNAKLYAFITLSSICLINILNYKIFNKRHDIGILRALGMTDGQIKNLIYSEAYAYAIISTILAWLIAIFRQINYINTMEKINHVVGIRLSISLGNYLFVFIYCLLLCFFASYLPIKKILNHYISDEIRSLE